MPKTHNPFTDEQIAELSCNPYVKEITRKTIRFTNEFKQYFYQRRQEGEFVKNILIDCGINPEFLGEKRIEGLRYNIKKQAERDEGFIDKRQYNKFHPVKKVDDTVESRVKYLEHELAYTRQEVEFLKKLQMADMEARKQWESKHRPK